jgi:hypothetical protein
VAASMRLRVIMARSPLTDQVVSPTASIMNLWALWHAL